MNQFKDEAQKAELEAKLCQDELDYIEDKLSKAKDDLSNAKIPKARLSKDVAMGGELNSASDSNSSDQESQNRRSRKYHRARGHYGYVDAFEDCDFQLQVKTKEIDYDILKAALKDSLICC